MRYPWQVPVATERRGNLEQAVDFVYWLSKPENTTRFADAAGVLNMEEGATVKPSMQAFSTAASNVSPLAGGELSLPPQLIITRSQLLEQYVNGTMSLPDAMARLQTEMNTDARAAASLYGLGA